MEKKSPRRLKPIADYNANIRRYTWGNTIHKTIQKHRTHKTKAKHTQQENKHKTNNLKNN